MRKTQKNILGVLGLLLVVAMTIVATFVPGLGVSATSTMTDNITVRVVGSTPNVEIKGIDPDASLVNPKQTIIVEYENLEELKVVIIYKDKNGVEHEETLVNTTVPPESGQYPVNIDLSDSRYPYTDYTIVATGTGYDGVSDEEYVEFSLVPFDAEMEENEETPDRPEIIIDYCDGTPSDCEKNSEIKRIEIKIFNEDGELVTPLSPIDVTPPMDSIIIPFDEYDLPPGEYKIVITAYDQDDNVVYVKTLIKVIKGQDDGDKEDVIPVPDTNAPDTGGLLKNLHISKADFLITGLLIFFVAAIFAIVFIARRNRHSAKRR